MRVIQNHSPDQFSSLKVLKLSFFAGKGTVVIRELEIFLSSLGVLNYKAQWFLAFKNRCFSFHCLCAKGSMMSGFLCHRSTACLHGWNMATASQGFLRAFVQVFSVFSLLSCHWLLALEHFLSRMGNFISSCSLYISLLNVYSKNELNKQNCFLISRIF